VERVTLTAASLLLCAACSTWDKGVDTGAGGSAGSGTDIEVTGEPPVVFYYQVTRFEDTFWTDCGDGGTGCEAPYSTLAEQQGLYPEARMGSSAPPGTVCEGHIALHPDTDGYDPDGVWKLTSLGVEGYTTHDTDVDKEVYPEAWDPLFATSYWHGGITATTLNSRLSNVPSWLTFGASHGAGGVSAGISGSGLVGGFTDMWAARVLGPGAAQRGGAEISPTGAWSMNDSFDSDWDEAAFEEMEEAVYTDWCEKYNFRKPGANQLAYWLELVASLEEYNDAMADTDPDQCSSIVMLSNTGTNRCAKFWWGEQSLEIRPDHVIPASSTRSLDAEGGCLTVYDTGDNVAEQVCGESEDELEEELQLRDVDRSLLESPLQFADLPSSVGLGIGGHSCTPGSGTFVLYPQRLYARTDDHDYKSTWRFLESGDHGFGGLAFFTSLRLVSAGNNEEVFAFQPGTGRRLVLADQAHDDLGLGRWPTNAKFYVKQREAQGVDLLQLARIEASWDCGLAPELVDAGFEPTEDSASMPAAYLLSAPFSASSLLQQVLPLLGYDASITEVAALAAGRQLLGEGFLSLEQDFIVRFNPDNPFGPTLAVEFLDAFHQSYGRRLEQNADGTYALAGDWGEDVSFDLTVWQEGGDTDQRLVAEGTITVRDVAIDGRWELPLYWAG